MGLALAMSAALRRLASEHLHKNGAISVQSCWGHVSTLKYKVVVTAHGRSKQALWETRSLRAVSPRYRAHSVGVLEYQVLDRQCCGID